MKKLNALYNAALLSVVSAVPALAQTAPDEQFGITADSFLNLKTALVAVGGFLITISLIMMAYRRVSRMAR